MSERQYWIAFNLVKGIGPVRVRQMLAMFGTLEEAWGASPTNLKEAGLDRRALNSLLETRKRIDPGAEQARLDRLGIAVLTWDDPEYPALLGQLRSIDHAPPVLYLRGTLTDTDEWAVAVVGTRGVSAYGRQVAHQITSDLAASGVTIVSGLARGVDGEAHQAALDAGGRTVAVLACGLDTIYPPEHRQLAAKIIQQGAIMTHFPLGTKPLGTNFSARNQVMSGLSKGVVVIEAGHKSGALLTAGHALEQGREVFAVPGNITAHNSAGTNQLIQDGAHPVLDAQDILDVLELGEVTQYIQARQTLPEVSGDERAVLECLSVEALHIDEIVNQSGLPAATVSSVLIMLELKGMARQVGSMQYVRN